MSSGAPRRVTGSVNGTGNAINVDTVGFKPRKVEVYQVANTTKAQGVWYSDFGDGALAKVVAAADFVTSNGITARPEGFQIGTDADINVSGKKIVWVAEE